MCQYLSAGVLKKGPLKIVVGETPKSHGNIAELNGLKQDDVAEFEWTEDDVSSLEVRHIDEMEKERLTKLILSAYPTRKKLEKYVWKEFWKRGTKFEGSFDLSYTPITTLPKGLKVGGSLDVSNTLITTLPEDMEVKDFIYIHNTKIEKIPDKFKDKIIR